MADDNHITGREFGKLEGKVDGLCSDMGEIKGGIKSINDTLTGVITATASKGELTEVRKSASGAFWKIIGIITGLAGFVFWIATRCC